MPDCRTHLGKLYCSTHRNYCISLVAPNQFACSPLTNPSDEHCKIVIVSEPEFAPASKITLSVGYDEPDQCVEEALRQVSTRPSDLARLASYHRAQAAARRRGAWLTILGALLLLGLAWGLYIGVSLLLAP